MSNSNNCNCSDNQFGVCCGCPARMSDGKIFTNYLLNSKLNGYIQNLNNINNEHEYRFLLQKNADTIISNERNFLDQNKKCNKTKLNKNSKKQNLNYSISGNRV